MKFLLLRRGAREQRNGFGDDVGGAEIDEQFAERLIHGRVPRRILRLPHVEHALRSRSLGPSLPNETHRERAQREELLLHVERGPAELIHPRNNLALQRAFAHPAQAQQGRERGRGVAFGERAVRPLTRRPPFQFHSRCITHPMVRVSKARPHVRRGGAG